MNKAMKEFRSEAIERADELGSMRGAAYDRGMVNLIDHMIENFPQENQPETVEPKPRWRDRANGDIYTVREVDDGWETWLVSERDGLNQQTKNLGMNETYPSEQKAIDALDEWCKKYSHWERCDEEEESFDEVLAEILELRVKLNLGVIFVTGDGQGQWGVQSGHESLSIGDHYTLSGLLKTLRDLREKAKPEPVTREQLEESVDYLHDETSNDHVAHRHYDRAKRFIGELK